MTIHLSPPVPELDDDRIALRRAHLVAEISRPERSRAKRRVGYGVGFTGAAGTATAALLLVSGGASPAFASWTAEPTPTTPSLVDCPTAAGSGTPVLAEKRGDYTMTVVEDGNSLTTCLSGDGIQAGTASASADATEPAAGTVVLGPSAGRGTAATMSGSARLSGSATTDGGPAAGTGPTSMSASPGEIVLRTKDGGVSLVTGRVGSGVTSVQVVRSDGTAVDASVKGSWFAAWWPGSATATKLTWTTADGGTHSSAVPKPATPDLPPPGAVIRGGTSSESGTRIETQDDTGTARLQTSP